MHLIICFDAFVALIIKSILYCFSFLFLTRFYLVVMCIFCVCSKGSHSTKVEAVVRTLMKIQLRDPGAKALVFSTV